MKNKIIYIIIFFLSLVKHVNSENIEMNADSITIDKTNQKTIFEKNVIIKDEDGTIIKSNYAEYSKIEELITLKDNIIINDINKNKLEANEATFNNNLKILRTFGKTTFLSSEGYSLTSSNIILDNKKRGIANANTFKIGMDSNQLIPSKIHSFY